MANLSDLGSYSSGAFPDAVAIAPNGKVAIGTVNDLDNNGVFTTLFAYDPNANLVQGYDLARADYERGTDNANLDNDSAWQYFMTER